MRFPFKALICFGLVLAAQGKEANGPEQDSEGQKHAVNISPGDLYWLLHNACFRGDEIGVKILLRAGADVDGVQGYAANLRENNAYGFEPNRPINDAAREGHTNIVRLLLEAGAQVDNPDWENEAALLWAVVGGHVETVKLLLASGADPSRNNSSALRQARNLGHAEIERMLLNAKRAAEHAADDQLPARAELKVE